MGRLTRAHLWLLASACRCGDFIRGGAHLVLFAGSGMCGERWNCRGQRQEDALSHAMTDARAVPGYRNRTVLPVRLPGLRGPDRVS
jgi:hypothetical protein